MSLAESKTANPRNTIEALLVVRARLEITINVFMRDSTFHMARARLKSHLALPLCTDVLPRFSTLSAISFLHQSWPRLYILASNHEQSQYAVVYIFPERAVQYLQGTVYMHCALEFSQFMMRSIVSVVGLIPIRMQDFEHVHIHAARHGILANPSLFFQKITKIRIVSSSKNPGGLQSRSPVRPSRLLGVSPLTTKKKYTTFPDTLSH
jgi:hypothetical protein